MPAIGDKVICPPDRGDPEGKGVVTAVGNDTYLTAVVAIPYVWVTVKNNRTGNKAVWPSHRLGYNIRGLT